MLLVPSETSSTYGVYPTYPPLDLLSFNPAANPRAVHPPPADHTLARPYNVGPEIYDNLLHPAVPITIAIVYAVTVRYINQLNKEREHKPWNFSTTLPFYILVVVHNIGLAIYSGWTFIGMLNTIKQSWPGWDGEYGSAGVADALCKINGPRGLGSAATYDMSTASWGFTDHAMKLSGLEPDSADVGRIWNEGLAYYGFFFYLSKFYEVVDTAIILAKGKQSSSLQTFHHAGAMLCLWAGIRYMSPPIWMFTFINSGLHTLMYIYYTLSALTIYVPPMLKRTLTTLQIIQIFFGTSYALLHLFIAYDIPVSSPYVFAKNLSSALPSAASTATSAAMSLATSGDFAAWLKKAALRAAGEEGLAENVRNYQGETFGIDAVHAAQAEKAQEEIRYRMTTQRVNCLDTSGQVFAILLNAIYLLPLAYLFCQFFYGAYIARAQQEPPKPTTPENIKQSAQEAVDSVEAKIKQAINDTQGGITEPPPDVKAQLDDLHTRSKQIAKNAEDAMKNRSAEAKENMQRDLEKMQEKLKALREKGNQVGEKAINKIKDAAADLPENARKGAQQAQKGTQDLGSKVKDAAGQAMDAAGNAVADIKQGAQDGYNKAAKAGNDKTQAAKDEAKNAADEADKKANDTANDAKKVADNAGSKAKDGAKDAKKGAEDAGNKTKESANDAVDGVSKGDDPAAKAPQDTEKLADKASNAGKDADKNTGDRPSNDKAPPVEGEAHKRANEAGKKAEEKGNKKNDEKENKEPKASTEEERSGEGLGNGFGNKDLTPVGNLEKAKKEKKEGTKENWWSKK